MIDQEIERNEITVKALADAFYGSTYAPRITGYAGVYTITRRGSETITLTQDEIAARGVDALIGEIVKAWDRA
jgi:hypothetical protein